MAGFGNGIPARNKQKTSKNGPQLLEAAVRAHKKGDTTNAETLYIDAINSGFHHEIAFTNLGVIYKNSDRKEKAIAIYERAIAKNPNFADAYTNLGNLYKDLGNLDQALASTLKSLELKPDNSDALSNLFSSYGEGDLPLIKSMTHRAVEHNKDLLNDPSYIEVISSLGKDFAENIISTAASMSSAFLRPVPSHKAKQG